MNLNDWLPCPYAASLIGLATVIAAVLGFWIGRMREQLALLETLHPET
jgi:putative Mn2+ efflux pump MntP